MKAPCAFAIPGDPQQKTGGFIYEWRLLQALRESGRAVRYLRLAESGAEPTPAQVRATMSELASLPAEVPLILDGLVFGAMPTAALACLRSPLIAMLHHPMGMEQGLPPRLAARLLAQEQASLALAAAIVVTSPHSRGVYARLGADPARIIVARPGMPRPPAAPAAGNPARILSVGLMARRKGHDLLIRALAAIDDLPWTAHVVGKGFDAGYEAELRALIASSGTGDRVRLTGELSDAALDAEWRQAGIFALATRYEGYGMALAEAVCRGLPVVTCSTGAVPETVGAAALLVPPDDVPALAAALRRLLARAEERARLSAAALAHAREYPTWEDAARIMGEVVDRLSPGAR